jgi:hypothetical protein
LFFIIKITPCIMKIPAIAVYAQCGYWGVAYKCVSRQCKKDRATLKVNIKNVNLRLKKRN